MMKIVHVIALAVGFVGGTQTASAAPFRLLLESNSDRAGGSEVFAASFATFDDFINSPPSAGGMFSGINIASTFDVVGFAHEFQTASVPTSVPEPSSLVLFLTGVLGFALNRPTRRVVTRRIRRASAQ